jgi:hypothetical protein
MKYTRILIFSFQSNKATVLDHIVPTTLSINSVELELHDRKVCFEHLCYGLTKIDLAFIVNLSCYVTSLCLCHPCHYYGYLNRTSMENRIWGDGIGNLPV